MHNFLLCTMNVDSFGVENVGLVNEDNMVSKLSNREFGRHQCRIDRQVRRGCFL